MSEVPLHACQVHPYGARAVDGGERVLVFEKPL